MSNTLMHITVPYASIGVILLSVAVAGCDDGRPRRVPVSGQVLIDGRPLQVGAIRFSPDDGRPATGELDGQGRFSLSTFERGDGCVLGTHRVAVISVEELNSTTRRWNTPMAYAAPSNSGLTQTIDGPTDSLLIELTWGTEKGPIIERFYGE
jgi:hypothetical protein